MYSVGKDWRNKNINMLDPRQYNIESYYTDALQKKEMKHSFGEDLLNNLHLHPDALKKNLADTIITSEENKPTKRDKNLLNMATVDAEPPIMENSANGKHMPSFAGISNFFSGVLSVISGAVAQLRPKSPAHVQYYDCFDDSLQGPPQAWQSSNIEVQNKSVLTAHSNSKSDMNVDCKTAAAQCEDKLNKVRFLLTTKPIQTPKLRPRRPKKVFVEPGSVEESFEDAFAPEDFISIANSKFIEYYSPFEIHKENLLQTSSPKVKTEKTVLENTDIVKTLPVVEVECENVKCETENKMVNHVVDSKTVENNVCEGKELEKSSREELVSSCEDKLSKLKALLQEKRKKNTTATTSPDSSPETVAKSIDIHKPPKLNDKTKNKRYKNPCRTTDKRKKDKLRKSIQDDLLFAQEINNEELSSVENSPSINSLDRLSESNISLEKVIDTTNSSVEYFDEVSGRFHTASTTESEDSFQIVFKDNNKEKRVRRASDCDSEDSFIVFEETPDNCYTSNDVFGDSDDSGSEYTDSDSDLSDNEDGPAKKICHTLSRTLSDLTDGSLYEDKTVDEVDCAVRKVCDIASQEISDLSDQVQHMDIETRSNGVLLTEAKKLQRKDQPPKTVSFSTQPPKVHVMRVWAFAARQARAGHWERCALDRDRFKRRIADVDMAVSWVLKPQHRSRVMFQRFMPWWNAQRRRELAEKKARAEVEKAKEAESLKREAELEEESRNQHVEELVNGNADVLKDNDCDKQQQSIDISNENRSVDSNVLNATNDKVKNDVANKTSVNCNKQDTCNSSVDNNSSADSNVVINDAKNGKFANKTSVNFKKKDACNISVDKNSSVDSNVVINDAKNGKFANKTSVNLKKQDTCNISLGNKGNVVRQVIINDTKNGKVANGDIAYNSKSNFKSVGVVIKNDIKKSNLNVDIAVKAKIVQDFKYKCRNDTLSNT